MFFILFFFCAVVLYLYFWLQENRVLDSASGRGDQRVFAPDNIPVDDTTRAKLALLSRRVLEDASVTKSRLGPERVEAACVGFARRAVRAHVDGTDHELGLSSDELRTALRRRLHTAAGRAKPLQIAAFELVHASIERECEAVTFLADYGGNGTHDLWTFEYRAHSWHLSAIEASRVGVPGWPHLFGEAATLVFEVPRQGELWAAMDRGGVRLGTLDRALETFVELEKARGADALDALGRLSLTSVLQIAERTLMEERIAAGVRVERRYLRLLRATLDALDAQDEDGEAVATVRVEYQTRLVRHAAGTEQVGDLNRYKRVLRFVRFGEAWLLDEDLSPEDAAARKDAWAEAAERAAHRIDLAIVDVLPPASEATWEGQTRGGVRIGGSADSVAVGNVTFSMREPVGVQISHHRVDGAVWCSVQLRQRRSEGEGWLSAEVAAPATSIGPLERATRYLESDGWALAPEDMTKLLATLHFVHETTPGGIFERSA